ncbi:hypothetical protein [Psychrobacter immobilis]|uniref:hypothetical protein n=1 Tax=Psychrobacter immobilis TaxID=498 RepID=UPI00191B53C6|nr:hypothetical protein [Psychrobacter immobilis]
MDDTMSSYSFSHQFYQRWTCAPEPIRAAITQELEDITTLLQVETPFESFVFQTHDLDAHVDELYENYEAEQAIAKAIADKQAQARAAAEQQRLEDEQKRQAVEEAKRKEAAELEEKARLREEADAAQKEQERNALILVDKNNLDESVATVNEDHSDTISADNSVADSVDNDNVANSTSEISTGNNSTENSAAKNSSDTKTISEHANAIADNSIKNGSNVKNDHNIKNDNSVKAINDKANAAISFVLKDAKSSVTHQELIRELEIQIDDYLSDQMMLMSENLKSWLRAEVTQHLSEQGTSTSVANEEVAKKNSH